MPASHAASPSLRAARASSGPWLLAQHLARPLTLIVAATALRRSRLCLLDLDAHLLRDVGLTPEAARAEAARPAWEALDRVPWDVPAHWLR